MSPLSSDPAACALPRAQSWWDRRVAHAVLAFAVLALGGCDQDGVGGPPAAAEPEVHASELTDAGGRPCPRRLPLGDDPSGHGFGTEDPAEETPTLLEPQKAWVCAYQPMDAGTTSDRGATYRWHRVGRPDPVAAADLTGLRDALDDLVPADAEQACTADLGPRWMVVYSHDGDLTGVVVDDYGCRDVRLTDNPHVTPPGATTRRERSAASSLAAGRSSRPLAWAAPADPSRAHRPTCRTDRAPTRGTGGGTITLSGRVRSPGRCSARSGRWRRGRRGTGRRC